MPKKIAIVGTGPAALMAAATAAGHGHKITIFEKNKGPGQKLLIAGGSGLNISNSLPHDQFCAEYTGDGIDWSDLFKNFSVADWLDFIHKLGLETFAGTSGRFFVREMKASGLLRSWLASLEQHGADFQFDHECVGFRRDSKRLELSFAAGAKIHCDAVLFALGGGSWLKDEARWPQIFSAHGIAVNPFTPANAGFIVDWKPEFLREAENKPLKNIEFFSGLGRKKGDLMITSYGIEGTPVYTVGMPDLCFIDLKPDLSESQIQQKMNSIRENLSPLRRATKKLNLDEAALALIFHHAPAAALTSVEAFAAVIKHFPVMLQAARPLSEAISSRGGVALNEIDSSFQLKGTPGVFIAGEMLDWSAPTGGFLIQASVSQGFVAAQGMLKYLNA